jgi:four helix bundle protein
MRRLDIEAKDKKEGFRRLIVWQRAYELTLAIYKHTKNFPKSEQYGLTSQIRRAAVSIPANISEGYERRSRKEYLQFLGIAKGSMGEVETYLLLARDLDYLDNEVYEILETQRQEIGRLLKGLIKSLS